MAQETITVVRSENAFHAYVEGKILCGVELSIKPSTARFHISRLCPVCHEMIQE
jgi:hypothetical protein